MIIKTENIINTAGNLTPKNKKIATHKGNIYNIIGRKCPHITYCTHWSPECASNYINCNKRSYY